jgi:hypothetical protein
MNMDFITLVSLISAVLTIVITLFQLGINIIRKKEELNKISRADEKAYLEVMESNDLDKIGKYLDDVIGNFDMREYAENKKIRDTLDLYIEKLKSFIGTDNEIIKSANETQKDVYKTNASDLVASVIVRPKLTQEFQVILDELYSGETWNSLAKLRRLIEIKLKEALLKEGIKIDKSIGAGQLLEIYYKHKQLNTKIDFVQMKSAISICNKAIHGIETDTKIAENTIFEVFNNITNL